jgi:glycosyltransferase involved in cell wall biosynthesis
MVLQDIYRRNIMISIVMPVYNGEKYLKQSIESVIHQTYKNWELIIVNDCSTDKSRSIMQYYANEDERINIIDNEINLKVAQSLNKGFQNAKGKYFTWTSDDNLYKPDALKELSFFLDNNPDIGLVYSNEDVVDSELNYVKEDRLNPQMLLYADCIGASFMYRKEVADKIGGYDPEMFLVDDYDYWIRVSKHYKIAHLDRNIYIYRMHPNNLTTTKKEECNKQLYNLRRKHLDYLISNINSKYKEMLFIDMAVQNIDEYDYLLRKFELSNEKFDWVKNNNVDIDKKIILFGAGIIAKRAIQLYGKNKIAYIIDNDVKKINNKLEDIDIISLKHYMNYINNNQKMQIVITVGSQYVLEVVNQLIKNNISNFCWFKVIESDNIN